MALRSDLYFRLNVVHVAMPPLREHLDDLPDLAAALLEGLNRKHGRSVKSISPEAWTLCESTRGRETSANFAIPWNGRCDLPR